MANQFLILICSTVYAAHTYCVHSNICTTLYHELTHLVLLIKSFLKNYSGYSSYVTHYDGCFHVKVSFVSHSLT